jgi:transcription initiation factor TFIIB
MNQLTLYPKHGAETRRTSERNATTRNESERKETKRREAAPIACPECGGRIVVDDEHGETACVDCGLVVEEGRVDPGPEWRSYDEDAESRSRVGAPTTKMLHDKGLSTVIDWRNADAYGKSLTADQRDRMRRIRTWDERFRTRDSKERNLMQALGEIERMASALGLPTEVRETASVIYRRALAENLLPGRSIEGVATAAVYAAARQAGTPRSIPEVAAVSRVDEQDFKRTYRYVVRELGLDVKLADPEHYLRRFASAVGASDDTERRARELLRYGAEQGVTVGKSPVSIAAGALYAAGRFTNEKLTQREVAAVADVGEVTVRDRYKELVEAAERAEGLFGDGGPKSAPPAAG